MFSLLFSLVVQVVEVQFFSLFFFSYCSVNVAYYVNQYEAQLRSVSLSIS